MSGNILLRRLKEEVINMINFKLRNEDQYEYWLDTLLFYKNIHEEEVVVGGI